MLCNIKPVPFHESDKHIFAKIPGGGPDPRSPPLDPPMGINMKLYRWIDYIKMECSAQNIISSWNV